MSTSAPGDEPTTSHHLQTLDRLARELEPHQKVAAAAALTEDLAPKDKVAAAIRLTRDLDPADRSAVALNVAQTLGQDDQAGIADQLLASQEDTRKTIALGLLCLLGVLVIAAVSAVFVTSVNEARVKDLFGLVFGPVVGLVGTVLGFYFGAQTAKTARRS